MLQPDVVQSNKATFMPKFFWQVAKGRNWAVYVHDVSSIWEYFCGKGDIAHNLFGLYFSWTVTITAGKSAGNLCPHRNEDHSCDYFQVLYSAVPSALYYFPGKTIVATQAQKVTFPLPPKLEKLQVCKLMPGACKEAETVHVGCLCINRWILDEKTALCYYILATWTYWVCPLPWGDGLVI